MDKINEFVNSDDLKEKFDRLKKDLFYETAHLSDMFEVKNSNKYKEILSYGEEILPIIIINNKVNYTLCFIIFDIIGRDRINIPESDKGYVNKIKDYIRNWWEENKHKYGK